ncbi:hypothetical protein K1719_025092 [Acacia pycnantha]|nr:hypothetical protein K1719_025092 [Acacia pycnantha]
MAVSVSSSAIPSLNLELSSPSTTHSSNPTKLSSLASLQFPVRTQLLRIGALRLSTPSRPRTLPLVKAKKQTFSSFDDLLVNSEKPVLVDFYATWCGPCQFMVPILNEVSTQLVDKIQIVKIDTEKYPSIADKYKIEALPTFIIFKDGKPLDRFEGALTVDQLIDRIEASLKAKQ